MALPPTVEKLWITVGISPFSVGKALFRINSAWGERRLTTSPPFLSTEESGLPTYFPQVFMKEIKVVIRTFIKKKGSLHRKAL